MKKLYKLISLVLFALTLTGCTQSAAETSAPDSSVTADITSTEQEQTTAQTETAALTTVEITHAVKDESEVISVDAENLFSYTLPSSMTLEETKVKQSELRKTADWFNKYVLYTGEDGVVPAYDFKLGGVNIRTVLKDFTFTKSEPTVSENGISSEVTAKRADGLTFRVSGTLYSDYPVCEWTVYIENNSKENTGNISDFYAVDYGFDCPGEAKINGNKGSCDNTNAFAPFEKSVKSGGSSSFTALYGKSSYNYLPFFALTAGEQNAIIGIGWSGQWKADFKNENGKLNARVYQQKLNAPLYPGESIRSPLVSVQLYGGSYVRGQNIFRSWILNDVYNAEAKQYVFGGPIRFDLMQNATSEGMISEIKAMKALGIKPDYFWMDAGWYKLSGGSWVNTGNWIPDKNRFPNGMSEVTSAAAEEGMKSVLWYEPERVVNGQFYSVGRKNKWLLKADTSIGGNVAATWYLWDLSNDAALDYLCKFMSASFKENGVSVYRQDANSDPLAYWVQGDRDFYGKRVGICENRYVTNLYKYWDYLLLNNEGLIIDNCASGGRRLDLETVRRSITVWRNDYCHDTTAQQLHTGGISAWLPLHGTGTIHSSYMAKGIGGGQPENYVFRSQMSPLLLLSWNFSDGGANWDILTGELNKYLTYRDNYLGDYYELTEHSSDADTFYAMQFMNKSDGGGMVLIYKRPGAKTDYFNLLMTGLYSDAVYDIYSLDSPENVVSYTGARLMQTGVPIEIPNAPSAVVLVFNEYKN